MKTEMLKGAELCGPIGWRVATEIAHGSAAVNGYLPLADFDTLVGLILDVAGRYDSWGDSDKEMAPAWLPSLLPLDEAAGVLDELLARFHTDLTSPLATPQEIWLPLGPGVNPPPPAGSSNYRRGFAGNPFPADTLWTTTPSATANYKRLIDVWELYLEAPVGRWQVNSQSPRVFEIVTLNHWEDLVTASGIVTTTGGEKTLDWAAASTAWDAVHLTWAGLLSSENAEANDLTMRQWRAERTLWLRTAFSDIRDLKSLDASAQSDTQSDDRRESFCASFTSS